MNAKLYYNGISNNEGYSSIRIENIYEVSSELKQSLLSAKHAAQTLTGKTLSQDTTLYFKERQQTIKGNSWQLILALGFTSLLTGIQLKNGITGSGIVRENGDIGPIGGLSQKIRAARKEGLSTFLVSMEQTADEEPIDTTGIQIIPVVNLIQAWCVASGQAPWQVIAAKC
jgi:PDZ domain-containing secreted protein